MDFLTDLLTRVELILHGYTILSTTAYNYNRKVSYISTRARRYYGWYHIADKQSMGQGYSQGEILTLPQHAEGTALESG